MAIKHTIRTAKGTETLMLTPIKAIRKHCIECMGFVSAEVARCTASLCPLFLYRMGDAHEFSDATKRRLAEKAQESPISKRGVH